MFGGEKMKIRAALFVVLLGMLVGCGKTGPVGPSGPGGSKGDPGPVGPGYSSVVMQPGPADTSGKDTLINAISTDMGEAPAIGFGYSAAAGITRALIYFDVTKANLPTDAVIVDAVLTLHPNMGGSAGNILACHLYPVSRDWDETSATWTAATSLINWSTPGGDYVGSLAIGSFVVDPVFTAPIAVHVNPDTIQNWLRGHVNKGFIIKSDNESGVDSGMSVYSREYSIDPTKRPSLRLIYGRSSQFGAASAERIRAQYKQQVLGH